MYDQYEKLLRHVYENGHQKTDRTGVGTRSVFGYQMRFDLSEGFPLVTTKKLHIRSIVHELLWFLSGSSNIGYLHDNKPEFRILNTDQFPGSPRGSYFFA